MHASKLMQGVEIFNNTSLGMLWFTVCELFKGGCWRLNYTVLSVITVSLYCVSTGQYKNANSYKIMTINQ